LKTGKIDVIGVEIFQIRLHRTVSHMILGGVT